MIGAPDDTEARIPLSPGATTETVKANVSATEISYARPMAHDVLDSISNLDGDMRAVIPAVNYCTRTIDTVVAKLVTDVNSLQGRVHGLENPEDVHETDLGKEIRLMKIRLDEQKRDYVNRFASTISVLNAMAEAQSLRHGSGAPDATALTQLEERLTANFRSLRDDFRSLDGTLNEQVADVSHRMDLFHMRLDNCEESLPAAQPP